MSAVAALLQSAAQLPALSVLSICMRDSDPVEQSPLTPLTGLAQLTALQLDFSDNFFASGMVDLSMLPSLQQLILVIFSGFCGILTAFYHLPAPGVDRLHAEPCRSRYRIRTRPCGLQRPASPAGDPLW